MSKMPGFQAQYQAVEEYFVKLLRSYFGGTDPTLASRLMDLEIGKIPEISLDETEPTGYGMRIPLVVNLGEESYHMNGIALWPGTGTGRTEECPNHFTQMRSHPSHSDEWVLNLASVTTDSLRVTRSYAVSILVPNQADARVPHQIIREARPCAPTHFVIRSSPETVFDPVPQKHSLKHLRESHAIFNMAPNLIQLMVFFNREYDSNALLLHKSVMIHTGLEKYYNK